ncbi:MAG: hypothetical protein IPK83_08775 [Planctomycetes bacterium]|nr:hypothetical protein [Planctomycetota bacterium]
MEKEPSWNGIRFDDGKVCLYIDVQSHAVERWFAYGPADATGHVVDMTAFHTMRILLDSLLKGDRAHQVITHRFTMNHAK